MPDVTGDADYEALRRLADAYIRVARTPHYQQMAAAACDHARLQSAEAAQAARSSAAKAAFKATEAAHKQAREALRDSAAAASRQRIADAKAAIPHHRRVIVAAEALQPLIEQLTSRSTVWTTAVQRALENPNVLAVASAWVKEATHQENLDAERQIEALESAATAGDLDEVLIDDLDQEITGDEVLDAAIEQAVTSLVEQHPLLSRARARRFVVSTVYIIWLLGLIGVGLVPGIGGAVTAGASGLGLDARTVGDFAGEGIRPPAVFPPEVEENPNSEGDEQSEQG